MRQKETNLAHLYNENKYNILYTQELHRYRKHIRSRIEGMHYMSTQLAQKCNVYKTRNNNKVNIEYRRKW